MHAQSHHVGDTANNPVQLVFEHSAGEGVVAAERHYDPLRAQLSAAAGVGAATALVSWGVAPLLDLQAPSLFSIESAFWSFLVAAGAGDHLCYCPNIYIWSTTMRNNTTY